jgi:hypothetical protein
MNTQTLLRISGMVLVAVAVSLVMLALVYALHHPQGIETLATVSWNG